MIQNELIYKTESFTDLENELTVTEGKGGRKGQLRSLGSICTHCYIYSE